MYTIAICSQKGGVGKSTTALTLGYGLAKRGYRTLLCDMDMQCNVTDTVRANNSEKVSTIYDIILADGKAVTEKAVQETEYQNLYMIPGHPSMENLEGIVRQKGINATVVKTSLQRVSSRFDYCVIDCPPGMGIPLYSSMIAADSIIVPLVADRYSILGLIKLDQVIEFIKENYNPSLRIAGILLTRHSDRMVFTRQMREQIESVAETLGTIVFERAIRETVKVKESQTIRVPLQEYAPYSTACMDYDAVIDEFIRRYGK